MNPHHPHHIKADAQKTLATALLRRLSSLWAYGMNERSDQPTIWLTDGQIMWKVCARASHKSLMKHGSRTLVFHFEQMITKNLANTLLAISITRCNTNWATNPRMGTMTPSIISHIWEEVDLQIRKTLSDRNTNIKRLFMTPNLLSLKKGVADKKCYNLWRKTYHLDKNRLPEFQRL